MSAGGADAVVVGARMARLFEDGWQLGTVIEPDKNDGEGLTIRFDSGQTKTMLPRAMLLLHKIDSNDTLQALLRSSGRAGDGEGAVAADANLGDELRARLGGRLACRLGSAPGPRMAGARGLGLRLGGHALGPRCGNERGGLCGVF